MAGEIPAGEPYQGSAAEAEFALVCSRFNAKYVHALRDHARAELERLAPGCTVQVYETPGSFEIPLMAQQVLAQRTDCSAVLCFGVIFEGQTGHAGLIASAISQGLMQVSLASAKPVTHEILLVRDEAQAEERCFGTTINRGVEAARAAVAMLNALQQLDEKPKALGFAY